MKKLLTPIIILGFAFIANAEPIYSPDASQQSGTFAIDACLGQVTGVSCLNKFGENPDVDTGGAESVWDGGGLYPWASLASAQALEIVSASANDDSAGTGARTVEVQGLDANYDLQTETVTLDGTTEVDLTNTFLRVFRMKVLTAGSGGVNAGIITLRLDGAGATVANILAGENQTLMAIYTVPRYHKLVVHKYLVDINGAAGSDVEFKVYVREEDSVFQLRRLLGLKGGATSIFISKLQIPEVYPAKTDIDIRTLTDANNTNVAAAFDGFLIRTEEG